MGWKTLLSRTSVPHENICEVKYYQGYLTRLCQGPRINEPTVLGSRIYEPTVTGSLMNFNQLSRHTKTTSGMSQSTSHIQILNIWRIGSIYQGADYINYLC